MKRSFESIGELANLEEDSIIDNEDSDVSGDVIVTKNEDKKRSVKNGHDDGDDILKSLSRSTLSTNVVPYMQTMNLFQQKLNKTQIVDILSEGSEKDGNLTCRFTGCIIEGECLKDFKECPLKITELCGAKVFKFYDNFGFNVTTDIKINLVDLDSGVALKIQNLPIFLKGSAKVYTQTCGGSKKKMTFETIKFMVENHNAESAVHRYLNVNNNINCKIYEIEKTGRHTLVDTQPFEYFKESVECYIGANLQKEKYDETTQCFYMSVRPVFIWAIRKL